MAVQFIFGRSGTGKTSRCISDIADALSKGKRGEPLVLLVPEQATYQAEKAILSSGGISGYSRLNVLSFDRLQYFVSGKNMARPAVSGIGRVMIVNRILREQRDNLRVLGRGAQSQGLCSQIAAAIMEMHQYDKTVDDIRGLVANLAKEPQNALTAAKFGDIAIVFEEYLKFIESKFVDPDSLLRETCAAVGESELIKGGVLWVDGFSGFTTSELAILTRLLQAAKKSFIAFCLDPAELDKDFKPAQLEVSSLFYPTLCSYEQLLEVITKSKLQLKEPIILRETKRFVQNPALVHIEKNLFSDNPPKLKISQDICVTAAQDIRAEVRLAVRQILELVKNKGLRYRDIAVIASDMNEYEHYIRAYFDDYEIPFFFDQKKLLSQHPLVRMLCSALQVVTEGFLSTDIFSYLKSDLVPISRGEVDNLENYCLAFGIRPADWTDGEVWRFADPKKSVFDEKQVNAIRDKVVMPLAKLKERLSDAEGALKPLSAKDFTGAVFEFLDELKVAGQLGGWAKEGGIDEHQQFYSKFVDVFDELVEVFADKNIECGDYLTILNAAFSQFSLAFIPPSLDQVLVGSIERSRHPDLKAVFLLGATQKQFP
ncbi:MAG: exodeoxyribonuclease V subunit gamma, partial [Phycisphaerae bacterium]|nr:exodeoxyribonuclease V subunit gamma [Phycisphaerae bacterium]